MTAASPEPTVETLRAALRELSPELARGAIVPRGLEPSEDPQWCAATAVVDGRFVVKFAWSGQASRRIVREARVIDELRSAAPGLPLPEVVARSETPALLVTRLVPAVPFFAVRDVVGPVERPGVARDLARVLTQLHDVPAPPGLPRATGEGLSTATAEVQRWLSTSTTEVQRERVPAWCEWADRVLATPGRDVLVHGDFHGDNHLWDRATLRLRLIVDWETAGVGEPEFDLRCLPGDGGVELLRATVDAYGEMSGVPLSLDRIMAWHVRAILEDIRWRTEAGVALPDGRTPGQWIDDLSERLKKSGCGPPAGR